MSENDDMQEICEAYGIAGVHPAAELFPLLTGREFEELCQSIGVHGLEQDIILTHDNYLLDGRNRLRACYETGAQERFKRIDEAYSHDYVGYVVRLNLHRRHLSESQRAVVAARVATMTRGNATGNNQHERKSANWPISYQEQISQPRAAEMLNVSERSIRRVATVEREAPDLIPRIERGDLTAGGAMRIVQERRAVPPAPVAPPQPEWTSDQRERQRIVMSGGVAVASMRSNCDEALIEWAKIEGRFVRIDRATAWGNVFELGDDGDRATVIGNYRWYLQHKPSLLRQLPNLRGKLLGCWCYPEACHGDVLVEACEHGY